MIIAEANVKISSSTCRPFSATFGQATACGVLPRLVAEHEFFFMFLLCVQCCRAWDVNLLVGLDKKLNEMHN